MDGVAVIRSAAPVRTLRGSARPPQRYANYAPRFWPRICHMGKTAASTGIVPIVPMVPVAFEQCFPKGAGRHRWWHGCWPADGWHLHPSSQWSTQRGCDSKYQL